MNEHAYFHWDLLRQPLQTPQFGMGAPFFDVNSILELRKEKSRDAARSRRGKENYEFYELAKLLPLPAAITSQLDKASIIRLTISYLKLRDFSCHGEPQWTQEGGPIHGKLTKGQSSRLDLVDPFESRQGTHILQSLDGFAFILANDGRFLYISETVSIYLGLSQVEMAGSSIFEYVHPQDHTELAEHLGMCIVTVGPSGNSPTSGSEDGSSPTTPRPSSPSEKGYMMVHKPDKSANKSISLRMKSTLTKRGVHVKTSGYRVVHILGTLRPQSAYGASRAGAQVNGTGAKSSSSEPPLLGLVGMAIALPPPTITELRLELDTFITRLTPDFKVIYCEPIISDLMDLTVEDFTDRLLYDLCHVADLKSLKRSHEDILTKGQALTDYYRIMNRHGGYVWVQTCATTLLNNKNAEDQSILAINYVVSGVENKASACDLWQVTGDVSSAMSSSSKSRCREEKLKELKASKSLGPPASKKLVMNLASPASSTPSLSPTSIPKTDLKTDDGKNTSCVKPNTATEKSSKTQPNSPTEDGGNLSPGKSTDGKNKRRKMDNPRKRKRSNSDAAEPHDRALNLTRGSQNSGVGAEVEKQSLCGSSEAAAAPGERNRPTMPPLILHPDLVTSSSPEDLSMKKTTANIPLDRRIIQHSSNAYTGVISPSREKKCVTDKLESQSSVSPVSSIAGSSVQELEAAMNRHLPSNSSILDGSLPNDGHPFNGSLTTSSAMPKSFSCLQSGISPTTAASSTSPWLTAQKPTGSDVLTASNFLRSLYANRESVIKTSSRSQVHFLNPEPPTSLLTPPEPDPTTYKDPHNPYAYGKSDSTNHGHIYDKNASFEAKDHIYRDQAPKDQFSFISYKDHIPTSYIDHISSSMYKDHLSNSYKDHLTSTYKDHLTSTYKDLSPYRDIIPAFTIPSLMSPTGRMHQAYPSLPHHFSVPMNPATMDACSITPPSSNSPEVGKQLPAQQQYDATSGYTSDMSATCNLSQKQTMLANPLPASASPTVHGGHYHPHTQRQAKEQLYHGGDMARGGYYGVTPQTAGSMYMDLNPTSTGQYETCNRPVLPWY